MFGNRWRLFRLFGIPVSLDLSWLVILALITWTLATGFFANEPATQNLPDYDRWVLGLITAVAFFLCILLHEMGHALVARRLGIPMRGITLFLFGGVAEMEGEPKSAGHEFLMAIAGPVGSAVLAGIFWLAARSGTDAGWPGAVVLICAYLATINLLVLVFNLIPAFPLDGGRVFRSIVWAATGRLRRATYIASLLGQAFAWFLIGWGVLALFSGNLFNGIWLCLIGMFLNNAARSSYQQVLVKEALKGEPVRRFMNADPVVVPPSVDLRHWVEDYVYRYHRKAFPVASNGRLEGFITTQALARYPREEWELHTVGEVMRHDLDRYSIGPDADALQALSQMQRTGSSRLLVTEGDRLVGIVSLKDLLRFLHLKLELEGPGDEEQNRPPTSPPQDAERPDHMIHT
jgi:Zn-dependent protease/CBS domain-containing protein